MKEIVIPAKETWDGAKGEFIFSEGGTLELEYSLRAIKKWENKYHKPFLSKDAKTEEETLYFIKCMTYNKVDDILYKFLTQNDFEEIQKYIADPMTATTINDRGRKGRIGKQILTAEVMYYWLVALQIPFEVQDWHLNNMFMLVAVTNEKNDPKKMSKSDIYKQNDALNAARKAKFKKH